MKDIADKVGSVLLLIGMVSLTLIILIIGIFGIGFAKDILSFFICLASIVFCLLSIGVVFFNIDINNILWSE